MVEYLRKSDVMAVVNRIVAQDIDTLPVHTFPDTPTIAVPQMASLDSTGKYTKLGGMPSIQPSSSEDADDKIQGLQIDLNELIRVCMTKDLAVIRDFVRMNYSFQFHAHRIADNAMPSSTNPEPDKLLKMVEEPIIIEETPKSIIIYIFRKLLPILRELAQRVRKIEGV